MADYHNRLPPEAQRDHARAGLDPEDRLTLDVLRLFGEADRLKNSYTSRQVPRKPTLEELDDPRKKWEDD